MNSSHVVMKTFKWSKDLKQKSKLNLDAINNYLSSPRFVLSLH